MDPVKEFDTKLAYLTLTEKHQGGGFFVVPSGKLLSFDTDLTAVRSLTNNNNFSISIYNQQKNEEVVSIDFLINPTDVTTGQTFIAQDSYTREGWLATIWGKGQPTLLANGTTAGFYLTGTGLTSVSRRQTMSFRNFMSIIAIFKNGGSYFLSGAQNKDLFGIDRGRVISVMDLLKISYDGTEYIGSFNNFTIEEKTDNPFRFTFNFEFVVSGQRGEPVEGHLRVCKNGVCNNIDSIQLETSGNYRYDQLISINPNSKDIRPPLNTSTSSGSEISSPGNTPVSATPAPGRFLIPASDRRNVTAFVKDLTDNQDIEIRQDLASADDRCSKKSVVNSFSNDVDLDGIISTAATNSNINVSPNMKTYVQTIMALEQSSTSYNNYMTAGRTFPTSGAGAMGPTQIMPSTYAGVQNSQKFLTYMKSFGYSATDCSGALGTHVRDAIYSGKSYPVYSGGILSTDPKFNLAVCTYLVATSYSKPIDGSNPMSNNTLDPAASVAVVAAAYNGGPGTFSNSKKDYSLANEAAVYGKTAYALASTSCSGSSLSQ